MKRYGDNVTCEDVSEGETENDPGPTALLFGGCGATYGAYPAPAKTPKAVKAPKNGLLAKPLSSLGSKRKKTQEE